MRNQHTFSITALLSLLFFCFSAAPGWADTLDPTFGNDGVISTSLNHYGDSAKAVVVDSNDKILVAGVSANSVDFDFSLARYNPDGSLDKTFNFDGIVTTQIGSGDDQATTVALQPDGKIIVAGYTSNGQDTDFALARYNTDGSLDSEFGLGGIAVLPVGIGDDKAHAVAIQEDGAILIAGSIGGTSGKVATLARINSTGAIDSSFGHNGFVFAESDKETTARDVLIQEDHSILLTGESVDKDGSTLLLMRYLANGQEDAGFGSNGTSATATLYTTETAGTSLSMQENGNILVAGYAGTENDQDIALFRFSAQGNYDASFGTRGMVTRDIHGEADGAHDLLSTEDAIVVGGYTTVNGLRDFVLLTYSFPQALPENEGDGQSSLLIGEPVVEQTYAESETLEKIAANNTPDISVTTTSVSSHDDTGYGIGVQKDNKVILVGSSDDGNLSSYTVARYSTDSSSKSAAQARSDESTSPYITTTPVNEIRRNSAFTGGTIRSGSNLTFTSRGVVFSIAPYPVVDGEAATLPDSATPTETTTTTTLDAEVTDLNGGLLSGKTVDGAGIGQYGSILSDLAIGTRFYVRAYATAEDGTSYYGNQLIFDTKDACFIATAAYGSLNHPHVTRLRTFRDRYLMQNPMGRKFVKLYYHYSPAIADTIDQYPVLRPVVRMFLLPLVGILSMISG